MSFFPHDEKALAKQDPARCQAEVSTGGRWAHYYQCRNKAVRTITVPAGMGRTMRARVCNIHDPEKQEERRKARGPTRYEREVAWSLARHKREERWTAMEKALRTIMPYLERITFKDLRSEAATARATLTRLLKEGT